MRKHHTKFEYFPKLVLFIAFYLPLDQKLIHNNNSMQGIIIGNLIQATEYEMYMHAKFEDLDIHIFL
jgi:hypothetical protein